MERMLCFVDQWTLTAHLHGETLTAGVSHRGDSTYERGKKPKAQQVAWTTRFIPNNTGGDSRKKKTKQDIPTTHILRLFYFTDGWLSPGRTNHGNWMQLMLSLGRNE